MTLEAIIGLEVHIQLKTRTKMFCRCDNRDDQPPNSAICRICSGQPGALPLPNETAISWAIRTALALGCRINATSKFDRKSYFYPDLPKGYQISQYDLPFGCDGRLALETDGRAREFRIHRLHLEEDAGKLIHPSGSEFSLVDLNRAGTPLMEIVTEPDFRTPAEARLFLEELQLIARYLGVSDADMEKGHLRCDANVSLRPQGELKLYPKTEIKNMNSFRSIEMALQYEIQRQSDLWEDGRAPSISSTRGWDDASGKTLEQRTKEGEADYRYFPEPDIPPIILREEFIESIGMSLPELPNARRHRLADQYGLNAKTVNALVSDKELGEYFEEVWSEYLGYAEAAGEGEVKKSEGHGGQDTGPAQRTANWLLNKITVDQRQTSGLQVPAVDTARLLWMLEQGTINAPSALQIYDQMRQTKKGPHTLMKELGLEQESRAEAIEMYVRKVVDANPAIVEQVRAGKTAAIQFLVGQVMKETRGKAEPRLVLSSLKQQLGI